MTAPSDHGPRPGATGVLDAAARAPLHAPSVVDTQLLATADGLAAVPRREPADVITIDG